MEYVKACSLRQPRGVRCCSAVPPLRPGRTCRNSPAPPTVAIRRLVAVILRGALDGLATVAPIGDPDYAVLHGSIALRADGPNAAVMLNLFFGLHPAMPEFARMYKQKQAAVIHAVATSYRDRSHFDGQDVLESGFAGPGRVQSGWLNRALESCPGATG